jgi:hypothetical protein
VARGTKEEPEDDRTLIVRPTNWLVILWDEIHLFRDPEFRSTFSFDGLSAPPLIDVPALAKEMNEGFQEKEQGERKSLGLLQEKLDKDYPQKEFDPQAFDRMRYLPRVDPKIKDGGQILYPDGSFEKTEITKAVGSLNLDQEQMEVRTSSWSGKKVLMRPGVYDQLADTAKKMFGPVEETRTLAEAQDLELYES